MLRRSVRERWPVTAEIRREIIRKLFGVIKRPRTQACLVQASRCILEADKLNVAEAKVKQDGAIAARPPITIVEVHLPAKEPLTLNGSNGHPLPIEVADAGPRGS